MRTIPMKRSILVLLLAAGFSWNTQAQTTLSLEDGWAQPPEQARLRAYWWWLNGNVTT